MTIDARLVERELLAGLGDGWSALAPLRDEAAVWRAVGDDADVLVVRTESGRLIRYPPGHLATVHGGRLKWHPPLELDEEGPTVGRYRLPEELSALVFDAFCLTRPA